ncbi:hypothetical protein UK23_25275 [Lentzea aerocolonigenes]|uniref:Uncharacterized protein n=2 Tax=Lentzea aerocolonigenes TaxID=68170 RepID=A0A0F0GUJ4_LENAE|nr:hypothetical protein UK23_25275 [Lentzea aerocolonigenes]
MLVTWIREVADEPLLFNGDPDAEAAANTWILGTDASAVAGDVVAAFEETARSQSERAVALGRTGTFYVWHDVQGGQLRCSTTSLPRDRLPFGAKLDLTVSLAAIVEGFLGDPGGFVAWSDLQEEPLPEAEFVLPVWAVEIG